ncbi:spermidine synthase [Pseudomonadota bacterium]
MRSSPVIHRSLSDEGVIEIVQDGDIRSLYFGSDAKQSSMDILQPERLVLSYTQMMMASLIFAPLPQNILLIGLGGGSLAKFLLHLFPGCHIDAVEFRHDVVKLAHGYFCVPENKQLTIHIGDGFDYLNSNKAKGREYDHIFVDAFNHDGVADSIKQMSFFYACHDKLSRNGVLNINLWNHKEDMYTHTMDCLENAFRQNVLTLPVKDKGNVITLATREEKEPQKFKTLKATAQQLEAQSNLPYGTYLRQLRRHNRWRKLSKLFI